MGSFQLITYTRVTSIFDVLPCLTQADSTSQKMFAKKSLDRAVNAPTASDSL